jgi:hypothetical protein
MEMVELVVLEIEGEVDEVGVEGEVEEVRQIMLHVV